MKYVQQRRHRGTVRDAALDAGADLPRVQARAWRGRVDERVRAAEHRETAVYEERNRGAVQQQSGLASAASQDHKLIAKDRVIQTNEQTTNEQEEIKFYEYA